MPSSDTLPVIFLAFANDHQNYLYKLTEEQNALREALESAESEGLCKVVYETDTDLDKIFKVFNKYKERIAVFHYGGHADDYTLLLKRGDGSRQVAHAGGLVDFLADQKGLQVVFINGCSSRQQAEELRDKGVPAVIGTLEPINDSMATVLSEAFYSALAAGRSLKQAWEGARKRVLAERGSEGYQLGGERSAGRRNAAKTVSFPWELYIRPGSEKVLEWNLPREAQNPLFGLPLPEKYYRRLPASPFLGLHYFKKEDAAIFFGRGAQIRQLYNHILDVHPIILFYGKTGVGKSSLLYAGLLPRIEDQFSVIYVRRNQSLGLTGTLEEALTEGILTGEDNDEKNLRRQQALELLGDIVNKIDDNWVAGQVAELIRSLSAKPGDLHSELPDLLKRWQQLEAFTGKPLIFILDQVEEKYTRPMARQRQVDELVEFLSVIQPLFSGDKAGIRGKLILSYRKEFHPEIRDTFQAMSLPYAEAFLRRLSPEGIAEAVEGITRERNTAAKYRVYIEKGPNGNLPEIIADDLWEDENSSVAPVLQIILKKMWGLAPVNDAGERDFTISLYQNLKKSGLTMAEFFEEQMDILRKKFPEAVESGLALDFLSAHTTAMGTAGRCSKEEVERMYPDRRELIEKLTRECIDLSLLLRMDGDFTILSHDTLAPVVIHEYNLSDKPGQRAARILKNKLLDFNESDPEVFLDEQDLEVVENGKPGMAAFSPAGEKLMAFSRAQSDLRRKKIRRRMLLTLAAVIPLVLIAIFIWLLKLESDSRTRQANFYIAKVFENKALLALDEATQTPSPQNFRDILLYASAALNQEIDADSQALAPQVVPKLLNPEWMRRAVLERSQLNLRPPNQAPILAAAMSEDNRYVVTATRDEKLYLWDTGAGSSRLLEAADTTAIYLAFRPQGDYLAAGFANGEIILYNLATGGKQTLYQSKDPITALAISPDGQKIAFATVNKFRPWLVPQSSTGQPLAIGSENDPAPAASANPNFQGLSDGRSALFETMSETLSAGDEGVATEPWSDSATVVVHQFEDGRQFPLKMAFGRVNSLSFDPQSAWVAVGQQNRMAQVWYYPTQVCERLIPHRGPVVRVAFGPRSTLLYSAANEEIQTHYWDSGIVEKDSLKFHYSGKLQSLRYFPREGFLVFGASDKTIGVADGARGALSRIPGHKGPVLAVNFEEEGKVLASVSSDGTFRRWDMDKGGKNVLAVHDDYVRAVAYSPDGKWFASGSEDYAVALLDLGTGNHQSYYDHDDYVSDVAFSPDNRYLASASEDSRVLVRDLQSGEVIATNEHGDYVMALAFHPRKPIIASGSDDFTIRLWDFMSDDSIVIRDHNDFTYCLDFHPGGGILAGGMDEGDIYLWDVSDPLNRKTLRLLEHRSTVYGVAFSPDGTLLASASGDSTVLLWDLSIGKVRQRLIGHQDQVNAVAFSPDGRTLASCGDDRTIILWDVASGNRKNELFGHSDIIFGVAFSPDGSTLASGSADNTVRFWDLTETSIFVDSQGRPTPLFDICAEGTAFLMGLKLQGLNYRTVTEAVRRDTPEKFRPLLDPPAPGKTKYDQLLQWAQSQLGEDSPK